MVRRHSVPWGRPQSRRRFLDDPAAPPLTWVDPEVPNAVPNFTDILRLVQACKGEDRPFSDPSNRPQTSTGIAQPDAPRQPGG